MNARLREQAAILCSAYASGCTDTLADLLASIAIHSLGSNRKADRVACLALAACSTEYLTLSQHGEWRPYEHWALAECLLRTGEFKGDER